MSDVIQVVLLDDVRRVYGDAGVIEVGNHPREGLTWYRNIPDKGGGIIGGHVIDLTEHQFNSRNARTDQPFIQRKYESEWEIIDE